MNTVGIPTYLIITFMASFSESSCQKSSVFANEFIEFLNESCTAFHAVEASKKRLAAAGFQFLSEKDEWNLVPGGKYYFTRNTTTVIAFSIGAKYSKSNGFTILGAHTDSPCLKIKPVTCFQKSDALVLNTQPYGGGLWHTWFDRDLGIAGRIIVKGENGEFLSKLVRIDEPIARIPNLAIHLTSGSEREHFAPNLQEHGKAILTMDPSIINLKAEDVGNSEHTSRLHPSLLQLVSNISQTAPETIEDMELQLIDIQPSTLGGMNKEFIFSGRLDNLCSSYQCLRALIDNSSEDLLADQTNISLSMLFDHEEVGSSSCTGAGSSLFMDTLQLIHSYLDGNTPTTTGSFMRSLRQSLVVSADMAHAQHPNYAGKHDSTMAPKINLGLVIKHNANQRYATNAVSASLFRRIGKLAGVPVQEFTVRSDSACGSTIGPIMSTLSGILTVDCGTPQFSMHSIREMMGAKDAYTGYLHLKATLQHHQHLATMVDSA